MSCTDEDLLAALDDFIEREIRPLEEGDNARFFDHRREWARTDFERDGIPRPEWDGLLAQARRRADAAGWFRFGLPRELGGSGASFRAIARVREHLGRRGIGLHDDPLYEHSVVGNFPVVLLLWAAGTPEQREEWIEPMITGERTVGFALTEPDYGSDATRMQTTARREGEEWLIEGTKRWNSGLHTATHDIVFARTSGEPGDPRGITAFLVATDSPGFHLEFFWWTMNLPTDHAEVRLEGVRATDEQIVGELDRGLEPIQTFVHEQRMRQAALSLGAARFCIAEAVDYARARHTWGKPLAANQGVQFPLAELETEAVMVRALIDQVADALDEGAGTAASHRIAMANLRANRLACDAADRAMQVCGGVGYSRHMPFEHIYRRHRRYRITEGADEIQLRKIARDLFARPIGTGRDRDPRAWPDG